MANNKNFEVVKTQIQGDYGTDRITIIVSHGDLDGIVSAAIMAKTMDVMDESYVVATSMDPTADMTTKMIESVRGQFIKGSGKNIDFRAIITDRDICSPDTIMANDIRGVIWCDHHKTSIERFESNRAQYAGMNVRDYITRDPEESGATMAIHAIYGLLEERIGNYNFYEDVDTNALIDTVWDWADITALWDTFTWKKGPTEKNSQENIDKALMASKAANIISPPILLDMVVNHIFDDCIPELKITSEIYQYELDKSIEAGLENSIEVNIFNGENEDIKVMIAKEVPLNHTSLFADSVFAMRDDIDVVSVLNNGTASTRVSQSSNIDASKIMQYIGDKYGFNGGGHTKAAGCKYRDRIESTTDTDVEIFVEDIREFFGLQGE